MKKYTLLLALIYFINIANAQVGMSRTVTTTKTSNGKTYIVVDDSENDENKKSKTITMLLDVADNTDLSIENTTRTIVIKTWKESKIKISTTVLYDGESSLSDAEWFGKLNINTKMVVKGNKTIVRLKSGLVGGNSYVEAGEDLAVFNGSGEQTSTVRNQKRTIVITIPNSTILDIDTKYADVQIDNNISEAKINITNGNVEMQDAASLILRSKYSNVNVGDIANAEVEITNGKLATKNIATLDIDSKYSSIETGDVATANIRSTNDSYEMEEVATFTGRKNYGSLRIEKLNKSFEFEGTNADVKIKTVAATVTLVAIDNKYSDIRLPLKQLPNYVLRFDGLYSTVYGNFEKKKWEDVKENKGNTVTNTTKNRFASRDDSDDCSCDSKFIANVGNNNGAKINIKCQNCTVDFK